MSEDADYTHEIDGYARDGGRWQVHYESHAMMLEDVPRLLAKLEAFCAYRMGQRGERTLILRHDEGGFNL